MEQTEKRKMSKWLFRTMIVIAILIVLAIGALVFIHSYINKSLAVIEGTIEIPGLIDEVTVITDDQGVPHIWASNEQDLFTAQGYVQAQHRLFQMELSRRQASGELSEIIGQATLTQDKYFRALGLRRAAEASFDLYNDEARDVLQWFSDGVNAYIEQAKDTGTLPVEFTLIGASPKEWTPLDSLTIGKYMAFDLGGHWERQAFNYYLIKNFSIEKAYELFPTYPAERMAIVDSETIDVATHFKKAVIPYEFNGSNNWVVGGEKTSSGFPLLADDPHLGLGAPSVWLQMHLATEDLNVSGVIFAGVPGIILGHNEHIAWGVTNTGPDVQQLYIEKRNPDDRTEFLFENTWEKATVIQEPIRVKGGDTIPYKVLETRHGPIISEFAEKTAGNRLFSLRWTALDPTPELQAILKMNRATNWEEFELALEDFHVPTQNFAFADKEGTIAYKANGKIPIYRDGSNALLPLPGWEAASEWSRFIPFDELPAVINPDIGFIATANNKIVSDDYPYHISNVWAQPYRYERIYDVLQQNNNLTVEDMQQLQMDQVNLRASEFIPMFTELLQSEHLTERENETLQLLAEWNYTDDVDLPQPLIFDWWMQNIEDILYEAIDDEVMSLFSNRGQTTDKLLRKGKRSMWIDEIGGLNKILRDALLQTLLDLEAEYGSNMLAWKWGDYHHIEFRHPLGEANKLLSYIYNRPSIPVGGSSVTPMAASHHESGRVFHGASWRFVIDMESPETGYHIVSPGQSEHIKSPWYDDQIEDWVDGIYHETHMLNNEGYELKFVNQHQ